MLLFKDESALFRYRSKKDETESTSITAFSRPGTVLEQTPDETVIIANILPEEPSDQFELNVSHIRKSEEIPVIEETMKPAIDELPVTSATKIDKIKEMDDEDKLQAKPLIAEPEEVPFTKMDKIKEMDDEDKIQAKPQIAEPEKVPSKKYTDEIKKDQDKVQTKKPVPEFVKIQEIRKTDDGINVEKEEKPKKGQIFSDILISESKAAHMIIPKSSERKLTDSTSLKLEQEHDSTPTSQAVISTDKKAETAPPKTITPLESIRKNIPSRICMCKFVPQKNRRPFSYHKINVSQEMSEMPAVSPKPPSQNLAPQITTNNTNTSTNNPKITSNKNTDTSKMRCITPTILADVSSREVPPTTTSDPEIEISEVTPVKSKEVKKETSNSKIESSVSASSTAITPPITSEKEKKKTSKSKLHSPLNTPETHFMPPVMSEEVKKKISATKALMPEKVPVNSVIPTTPFSLTLSEQETPTSSILKENQASLKPEIEGPPKTDESFLLSSPSPMLFTETKTNLYYDDVSFPKPSVTDTVSHSFLENVQNPLSNASPTKNEAAITTCLPDNKSSQLPSIEKETSTATLCNENKAYSRLSLESSMSALPIKERISAPVVTESDTRISLKIYESEPLPISPLTADEQKMPTSKLSIKKEFSMKETVTQKISQHSETQLQETTISLLFDKIEDLPVKSTPVSYSAEDPTPSAKCSKTEISPQTSKIPVISPLIAQGQEVQKNTASLNSSVKNVPSLDDEILPTTKHEGDVIPETDIMLDITPLVPETITIATYAESIEKTFLSDNEASSRNSITSAINSPAPVHPLMDKDLPVDASYQTVKFQNPLSLTEISSPAPPLHDLRTTDMANENKASPNNASLSISSTPEIPQTSEKLFNTFEISSLEKHKQSSLTQFKEDLLPSTTITSQPSPPMKKKSASAILSESLQKTTASTSADNEAARRTSVKYSSVTSTKKKEDLTGKTYSKIDDSPQPSVQLTPGLDSSEPFTEKEEHLAFETISNCDQSQKTPISPVEHPQLSLSIYEVSPATFPSESNIVQKTHSDTLPTGTTLPELPANIYASPILSLKTDELLSSEVQSIEKENLTEKTLGNSNESLKNSLTNELTPPLSSVPETQKNVFPVVTQTLPFTSIAPSISSSATSFMKPDPITIKFSGSDVSLKTSSVTKFSLVSKKPVIMPVTSSLEKLTHSTTVFKESDVISKTTTISDISLTSSFPVQESRSIKLSSENLQKISNIRLNFEASAATMPSQSEQEISNTPQPTDIHNLSLSPSTPVMSSEKKNLADLERIEPSEISEVHEIFPPFPVQPSKSSITKEVPSKLPVYLNKKPEIVTPTLNKSQILHSVSSSNYNEKYLTPSSKLIKYKKSESSTASSETDSLSSTVESRAADVLELYILFESAVRGKNMSSPGSATRSISTESSIHKSSFLDHSSDNFCPSRTHIICGNPSSCSLHSLLFNNPSVSSSVSSQYIFSQPLPMNSTAEKSVLLARRMKKSNEPGSSNLRDKHPGYADITFNPNSPERTIATISYSESNNPRSQTFTNKKPRSVPASHNSASPRIHNVRSYRRLKRKKYGSVATPSKASVSKNHREPKVSSSKPIKGILKHRATSDESDDKSSGSSLSSSSKI